jgi:hypothetical protein
VFSLTINIKETHHLIIEKNDMFFNIYFKIIFYMKNLITKFNEYGGPEKTIGFRYSKPEEQYKIVFPIVYDKEKISMKEILDKTTEILNDFDVFEFDIEEIKEEVIQVKVICYSEKEANKIGENIIKKLSHHFTVDINLNNGFVVF